MSPTLSREFLDLADNPRHVDITEPQALDFFDTHFWEIATPRQVVGFQLSVDRLCMPPKLWHQVISDVLGRAVYTHEIMFGTAALLEEFLGRRGAPSLEQICEAIPEEMRVVVGK